MNYPNRKGKNCTFFPQILGLHEWGFVGFCLQEWLKWSQMTSVRVFRSFWGMDDDDGQLTFLWHTFGLVRDTNEERRRTTERVEAGWRSTLGNILVLKNSSGPHISKILTENLFISTIYNISLIQDYLHEIWIILSRRRDPMWLLWVQSSY